MNKSKLSETDICDKFITPAVCRAGRRGMDQIYRAFPRRAVARVEELRRLRADLRQRLVASHRTQAHRVEAPVEAAVAA